MELLADPVRPAFLKTPELFLRRHLGIPGLSALAGATPDTVHPLWGRSALVLAIVQAAVGTANVLLYAPAWLQVLHLGLAVSLWVATVLLWGAVLATRDPDLIRAPPETP